MKITTHLSILLYARYSAADVSNSGDKRCQLRRHNIACSACMVYVLYSYNKVAQVENFYHLAYLAGIGLITRYYVIQHT